MARHHYKKYDDNGWILDADAARADFEKFEHYIENGVVRWSSSNNVPPRDLLTDWCEVGVISKGTLRASLEARDADLTAFVAEYKARQPARPSDEEMCEMRANFESGSVVVDVISGRRVRL